MENRYAFFAEVKFNNQNNTLYIRIYESAPYKSYAFNLEKVSDTRYEFLETETDTEKSYLTFNPAEKTFSIHYLSGFTVSDFHVSEITWERWDEIYN